MSVTAPPWQASSPTLAHSLLSRAQERLQAHLDTAAAADIPLPEFAARDLKILDKTEQLVPLVYNPAQRYLHAQIEQQRAETGMVRILGLKGRQQGFSTYVESRFFTHVIHRPGARAFILSADDDSAATIYEMSERFYWHLPEKPTKRRNNRKELLFATLDSGIRVATAGSQVAGRSKAINYFHGSEVAFWSNADKHLRGALQTVPRAAGSEIILESTSDGPQGVFYEKCLEALAGDSEYRLVFIPWYWQPEYRAPAPADWEPTADEAAYAALYGLDHAQLVWRRIKIRECGGLSAFQREYPSTVEEAFAADVEGALWNRELLDEHRVLQHPDLQRVIVAVDPEATNTPASDETGIVVVGVAPLGARTHAFVLDDCTLRGLPQEWAEAALAAYGRYRADLIIGERNNGGDMVRFTIEATAQARGLRVPVDLVWASRGKEARFGPVAALYQEGLVHHVGTLKALEDEMCTWVPGRSAWSPNRADALCWAVTAACGLTDTEAPPTATRAPQIDLWGQFGGRRR